MSLKNYISVFFILISWVLLSSCSNKNLIHKHKDIPNEKWDYNYQVPFNFSIKDTARTYHVYFHLRINANYPYSNIWIKSIEKRPDNNQSDKMIDIKIANNEGVWLGKGLGDIYDYKILIEENKKFRMAGAYRYSFKHELRVKEVEGVMDIGFSVEEVKP